MNSQDFSRVVSRCIAIDHRMAVTGYDRISAILLATLILVGGFTLLLFVMWVLSFERPLPLSPRPWPLVITTGDTVEISGDESLDEPLPSELPETGVPPVSEMIAGVLGVISQSRLQTGGASGNESGVPGPRRSLSPRLGNPGRSTGWEIDLTAVDRESYARQLDQFGIAILAVSRAPASVNEVFVLSSLSQVDAARVVTQSSRTEESARGTILFCHTDRRLAEWDRQMFQSMTGQDASEYVTGYRMPEVLVEQLARLEREYAATRGHELTDIHSTQFRIVDSAGGQVFEVAGQILRR